MTTRGAAYYIATSSHKDDDGMMPWSMTYVATPIAVAVREGCFALSEWRRCIY